MRKGAIDGINCTVVAFLLMIKLVPCEASREEIWTWVTLNWSIPQESHQEPQVPSRMKLEVNYRKPGAKGK